MQPPAQPKHACFRTVLVPDKYPWFLFAVSPHLLCPVISPKWNRTLCSVAWSRGHPCRTRQQSISLLLMSSFLLYFTVWLYQMVFKWIDRWTTCTFSYHGRCRCHDHSRTSICAHICSPLSWVWGGKARSHGQFLLNILRRSETVFQTTVLHSRQRCLRVPVSPLPHQHLLLSGFSYCYRYPAEWVVFEHCGLSTMSQNTNDTEGYVLTTQVSTRPPMPPRPDPVTV